MSAVLRPAPATLDKYGLSYGEWKAILDRQGGVCGACGRLPPSLKLNIDHEHVRGWKQMPPEKRKLYVRGLLCFTCNHYRLARGATPENLRGAADYLAAFLARLAASLGSKGGEVSGLGTNGNP